MKGSSVKLTDLEKTVILTALEKYMPRREELVDWALNLPEDDPEKANLLAAAKGQLESARSAYQKLK